jgi:hypothetical protein
MTSFTPLFSVTNSDSRTIVCLPNMPSNVTFSSSPPDRQLNGILESDWAVLVFRLKSYLTRWAFRTIVVTFCCPWEALCNKCCINFRAWNYHITHSLALSLRTFRIVNALAYLIILFLFFPTIFQFYYWLLLFFLLSYFTSLLFPSALSTYTFLIFFST